MSNLKNKIIFYVLLVFTISFVINTSKNIIRYIHLQQELEAQRAQLREITAQNEELREQLITLDESDLEALVRDKLSMAKEGETIIILPEDLKTYQLKSRVSPDSQDERQNWQKWLGLFI